MNQKEIDTNSGAKPAISDNESTGLRIEIIDYAKSRLDADQLNSSDFRDFETDIMIRGVLEGLVKLKDRAETDSAKQISKKILKVIEERYDILASVNNRYLKLRDLSWDKVFGVLPEIRQILKNRTSLSVQIVEFIDRIKEKCAHPYQYYWLLEEKFRDDRATKTEVEEFLYRYLGKYKRVTDQRAKDVNSKSTRSKILKMLKII
jgi:hypothetical protein